MATLSKSISALKRKRETILRERYLSDCWIGTYRPAGTAKGGNSYCQLRSRKPLENGKKSKHLAPYEIVHYRQIINNGRLLRKIEREVAYLERRGLSKRAVLTSSVSDEWYTPPEYIEFARSVMGGIDLDPASNELAQQWIRAERYFTVKDDGLRQDWIGRIWLNPPYGMQTTEWVDKAITEYENRNVSQAVLLLRPAAGTGWYQRLSSQFACCILHKRIRFWDSDGIEQRSPVHGNVFFYLGEDVARFKKVFGGIGVVSMVV